MFLPTWQYVPYSGYYFRLISQSIEKRVNIIPWKLRSSIDHMNLVAHVPHYRWGLVTGDVGNTRLCVNHGTKLWNTSLTGNIYELKTSYMYTVFVKCNTYLGNPDLRCNPSTFWLMTYFTTSFSTKLTSPIWVKVGSASSNLKSVSTFRPCFSSVHTPLGPRKSGIPVKSRKEIRWSLVCINRWWAWEKKKN